MLNGVVKSTVINATTFPPDADTDWVVAFVTEVMPSDAFKMRTAETCVVPEITYVMLAV